MAPLPAVDQRHPWLRYQIKEYTEGIRHSYEQRLETIWSRPVNQVHILDFEGLTPRDEAGSGNEVEDGIFLRGAADIRESCLEETVWDPSTFGDRHLRRHAEGRKSRARLSGGHFIGRLAMHFGLVSDEGLRGMQVVTRELLLIDLHELRRLNIYKRYSETWTWVALGPERKQGVPAGAHEADKAGQATKEVAPEIPAPAHVPSPPPPALQPCTMSQSIERVEEEVHHLRCDVTGLRGVVESFTTEQSKVSTWLISCMTQLMDASGQTYQPFDSTLVGSSQLSFRRRVRPRTSDASTFVAPHTDAQPDP
ncbi:hypothetical protein Tco_1077083 [Tanacetum coccineum]